METKRFKVTGEREDGGWGEDVSRPASVYVDATDPDAALRRAKWRLVRPTRAVPVPWEEGRGALWRLWRWLNGALRRSKDGSGRA